MSAETYTFTDSDFFKSVSQKAVEVELNRAEKIYDSSEVCTTGRRGARLGAELTLIVLRKAGVEIDQETLEDATKIARGMNQEDQDKGDD